MKLINSMTEEKISQWFQDHSFITLVYPLPYRCLYVTHATRALQSHDLSGRELWITYILLITQGHERPRGWGFSLKPGPPPRQHKHERRYTPSTYPFSLTRLPEICLTGDEKPLKKPHPGNLSRPGIETGPAAWQSRMPVKQIPYYVNSNF